MAKIYFRYPIIINSIILLSILVPQYLMAQISVDPNVDVQAKVINAFMDVPDMISIAKCESGFRQYNANGAAMHDWTGKYVGVFQIYEKIHSAKALSMGMDITTDDGNIAYAKYLYQNSGTAPWKGCLPSPASAPAVPQAAPSVPAVPAAPAPTPSQASSGSLTANLNFGMVSPEVLVLQQMLNKSGYPVASSGPGSAGQETSLFGMLTREAVRKFQCAKGIVCEGSESSTGYGRVGPMTRAALNSIAN